MMKTLVKALALGMFIACIAYGQHEMILEDFATSGKYLNELIRGDTTGTGARNDTDRVYVLRRGGFYFIDESMRNDSPTPWALRIRAEDLPGAKPIIYAYKNPGTGTYAGEMISVWADVWLKNLALVGWSEFLPGEDLSLMPPRVINVSGTGNTVVIDSCIISASRAASVQVSVASHKLQVTNTTFAQSGNLFATNIGNGRPIDLRNVSIDSVYIQNCSFVDGTDRVVRHYASVGPIGVFVFDHNTVVNALSMHGDLGLGYVGTNVNITNNLFVDNYVLGNDSTDTVRLTEFGDPGEVGPTGKFRMTFVGTIPNDTTAYVVRNNFYAVSPAVQTFYDSHADIGIGNLVPLTWFINGKLGADSVNAFTKESITLNQTTRNMVPFATWYYDPNGANKQKVNTGFNSDIDYARPPVRYYSDTLDLRYQTSAAAYTGADGGQPAGSLMWWGLTVGVDEHGGGTIPQQYALSQNYPNPFNPSTRISFDLPQAGNAVLTIYNLLGQEVATLVNEPLGAGTHEFTFDATQFSSGTYFYTLRAGDFVATRKMMLLK